MQFNVVEALELSSKTSLVRAQSESIVIDFGTGNPTCNSHFWRRLRPAQDNRVSLGLLLDDFVHEGSCKDDFAGAMGHWNCGCLLAFD